jgi:hypothetical protein
MVMAGALSQIVGRARIAVLGPTLPILNPVRVAEPEKRPFGWLGRYYQYRTISIWPRPVQKAHPPPLHVRLQPRGRGVRGAQPYRPSK